MPLPPALAKKLATRGILTENEGYINKYTIDFFLLNIIFGLSV